MAYKDTFTHDEDDFEFDELEEDDTDFEFDELEEDDTDFEFDELEEDDEEIDFDFNEELDKEIINTSTNELEEVEEDLDYLEEEQEEQEEDLKEIEEAQEEMSEKIIEQLSSDDGTFTFKYINIGDIAVAPRIRNNPVVDSLIVSINANGLLQPLVVTPTATEGIYVLIDGQKRLRACAKCGIKEIPCIVNNKISTSEIRILESIYNHYTEYKIQEIIDYINFLEKEKDILEQDTIEYLLQMEPGDYPKLKDILNDNDIDIMENLLSGKFSIEQAYKKLQKKRKDQTKDEKDNQKAQGAYSNEEGVTEIDGGEVGNEEPLTEEEIKELGIIPTVEELEDKSIDDLLEEGNQIEGFEPEIQKVGERHRLDPDLRKAVLAEHENTCLCCGVSGQSYISVLDCHHVVPVHLGGSDTKDNLITVCLVCHKLIHKHARGELYLPSKESLEGDEQERFKKIISYGNHIRKGMQSKGQKLQDFKKVDNAEKIGRESYSKKGK